MKQFDDRPDWSAEERFVNRSIRMRRHALVWMDKNINRHWNEVMKVAEECANEFKPLACSSITMYRWIAQFSAQNAPFRIEPTDLGYQLLRRRRLTRQDFLKWGIDPPKRFRRR